MRHLARLSLRTIAGFGIGFVFCSALLFIVVSFIPHLFAQPAINFASPITSEELAQVAHTPDRITIAKLNLDIAVRPARVVGNNWELFDDAIAWLDTSASLSQQGNVILYGHNKKDLLADLHTLVPGDVIRLESQGVIQEYVIYEKKETGPKDLSLVQETSDRLTLYTCSGLFDSKRLFVLAQPLKG